MKVKRAWRLLAHFVIAFLLLPAFGNGCKKDEISHPAVAILHLSTSGLLPAGTSISGISVTVSNPKDVIVKTDANGYPESTVVISSGVTAGQATVLSLPYLAPTTTAGVLTFLITSTTSSGFGIGEFATVNYDIADGSSPNATDFLVTDFKPFDLNGSPIPGLTPGVVANIK